VHGTGLISNLPAHDPSLYRSVLPLTQQEPVDDRIRSKKSFGPLRVAKAMKASDYAWYQWLWLAAMLVFVGLDGLLGIVGKPASDAISRCFEFVLLFGGLFFAIVALVRFLKWAWKD
jgi:hypothetical protein